MDHPCAHPPVQRSAKHIRDAGRYGRRSAHPGQTVLSLLHIRRKWWMAQQLCGPVHGKLPVNLAPSAAKKCQPFSEQKEKPLKSSGLADDEVGSATGNRTRV